MIEAHDTEDNISLPTPSGITKEVSGVSPDYEPTGSKQPYSIEENFTTTRGAN